MKRIAEAHSGQVTVESEGVPEKGSRFTVSLPWEPGRAAPKERVTPEKPANLPGL